MLLNSLVHRYSFSHLAVELLCTVGPLLLSVSLWNYPIKTNRRALSVAEQWAVSGHGDTTDESLLLSMEFHRDRPPYYLEILQWRRADNDPYPNSETL